MCGVSAPCPALLELPARRPNSNVIRVVAKAAREPRSPPGIPHPCPVQSPPTRVRAFWVLRPRCLRCSSSVVLTHSHHQAARSLEAPCWAQRDTCPCHPLPCCVHPHEAASFPEVPDHQLQSGWRTFPGPSRVPGTCRTSLGHQPAQNLLTRRDQALGGLFLPGERPPPLCGSTNPASQGGELVSGSWETLRCPPLTPIQQLHSAGSSAPPLGPAQKPWEARERHPVEGPKGRPKAEGGRPVDDPRYTGILPYQKYLEISESSLQLGKRNGKPHEFGPEKFEIC